MQDRTKARKVTALATPCVEWAGARSPDGYGHKRIGGKVSVVSRLAWEETHGPIPPGLLVLHHCDNPPCYRVDHRFLGTDADNMADQIAKGRHGMMLKTHCPQGHPYDEANTYWHGNNRQCRECRRRRWREAHPPQGKLSEKVGVLPCSVDGCTRAYKALGLCDTHYQQTRRAPQTWAAIDRVVA